MKLVYNPFTDKLDWVEDLSGYLKLDASNDPITGALTINTNSTSGFLVEQTGVKNNVFVVDTTNGRIGIFKANPSSILDIYWDGSTPDVEHLDITNIQYRSTVYRGDTGNSAPIFIGRSSRGTNAIPTATGTDDYLCGFVGRGYTGTTFTSSSSASFDVLAAENWTDSAQGAYFRIRTTPIGSTAAAGLTERLRVLDSGYVGINPISTIDNLLTLYQTADNNGIKIYGYDDVVASYGRISIQPTGTFEIRSNDTIKFNSTASYIYFESFADIYMDLGDSAGSNELRIRDDSTATVATIDSDGNAYFAGNVGIATTTPATALEVVSTSLTEGPIIGTRYVDGTGGAGYIGRKARGTPSAPTAALANDRLTSFGARGYHSGGAFATSATGQFGYYAAENYTATNMGTYFTITTTPIGSITDAERMRITDAGYVGIGTTPSYPFQMVTPSGIMQLVGSDNLTNATQKNFRIGVAHYTNTEEPLLYMMGSSNDIGNFVRFGGGSSYANAATELTFYTAANTTTILGTERMRIDSAGLVGINTTAPLSTNGGLDISSGGITLVGGANDSSTTRTDSVQKNFRIGSAHYLNAEEPAACLIMSSNATTNNILYGGGTSSFNAATNLIFYTAANNTTLTGTERWRIGSTGNLNNVGGVGSAYLNLKAGTADASTSPLKFTAGTNLTAAEAGAMEWDGTNLFVTQTSGPTRKTLAYTTDIPGSQDLDSVLTAGDTSASNSLTLTAGTLTAATLTDGTFSVTAGTITGAGGSNSMWTNDEGYLTAEADTLESVTGRGATTLQTVYLKSAVSLILGEIVEGSNTPGYFEMVSGGDNSFHTSFTTQTQSASINYLFPNAVAPADTGYYLSCDTAGTLTWASPVTITSIGDVSSGEAFYGTQGTTLIFYNEGGNASLIYDGLNFNFDYPLLIQSDLTLGTGSITSVSGSISFDDENLTTNGTITAGGTLLLQNIGTGSITDSSGFIVFGDNDISTTGPISNCKSIYQYNIATWTGTDNEANGVMSEVSVDGTGSGDIIGFRLGVAAGGGPVDFPTIGEMIGLRVASAYVSPNITNFRGVYVQTPSYTAGAAITNAYGLYIEDMAATNITNPYGVYVAGANAKNYFAGQVEIGTSSKLQFRDSALHIASLDDGHLDLTADVSIDLNGPTVLGSNTLYIGTIADGAALSWNATYNYLLENGTLVQQANSDAVIGAENITTSNDNLVIRRNAGAGANAYGGTIAFVALDTALDSGTRVAAIAMKQTGADKDQCGLDFLTQPEAGSPYNLRSALTINHLGDANFKYDVDIDATLGVDGQATFYGDIYITGDILDSDGDVSYAVVGRKIHYDNAGNTIGFDLDGGQIFRYDTTLSIDFEMSTLYASDGTTPVLSYGTQGAALTAGLTTITHTAPSTPDYALQDLTNSGGYGFATKDEGNTVLSVIANLQTKVQELEDRLEAYGLLASN